MVLVQPPVGESSPEIAVSAVENYEDYAASASVIMDAFEFPEAMRVEVAAELPRRWEEYQDPENPGRQYVARIGDEILGTAIATFGATGINCSAALFFRAPVGAACIAPSRWPDGKRQSSEARRL